MKSQRRLRQEKSEAFSASGTPRRRVGGRPACQALRKTWAWLPLVIGSLLIPRLSPAPVIYPTPAPTPYATVDFYVMYQDLDGRAGLVSSQDYPTSPPANAGVQFRDSPLGFRLPSLWSSVTLPSTYGGNIFDFAMQIPGVGFYQGTSRADVYFGDPRIYASPPYFVVPTTGQRLGQEMKLGKELGATSGGQSMAIRVIPYVSNNFAGAGYCVHILAGPDSNPSVDLTVTEMATDSTTVTVTQRRTLRLVATVMAEDTLYWGSGVWWDDDYSWRLGYEIPTPPVTLSAHVDGYTTATVTLTTLTPTILEWNALLHPLPDRPDVYRPTGLSIYQVLPDWMQTLVDGVAHGILDPASAEDQNSDGVLDVGDILAILNRDPYP